MFKAYKDLKILFSKYVSISSVELSGKFRIVRNNKKEVMQSSKQKMSHLVTSSGASAE